MMEIVKNIAAIVGLAVSIGALLCTTIPNIRATIVRWAFKDKEKESLQKEISDIKQMLETHMQEDRDEAVEFSKVKESQRSILRDHITKTYYKHLEDQTLHTYEMENLTHMKEAYDALDGNSFVGTIFEQMIEWKVIP